MDSSSLSFALENFWNHQAIPCTNISQSTLSPRLALASTHKQFCIGFTFSVVPAWTWLCSFSLSSGTLSPYCARATSPHSFMPCRLINLSISQLYTDIPTKFQEFYFLISLLKLQVPAHKSNGFMPIPHVEYWGITNFSSSSWDLGD